MKKTTLFLVLSLAFAPLFAVDVTVLVIDAELGIPLEGVRLQGSGIESVTTDAEGRARTGNWWRRTPIDFYIPTVTLTPEAR